MQSGAIKSFEDLEQWFRQGGNYYWILYPNPYKRGMLARVPDELGGDEDASWDSLRSTLDMHGGPGSTYLVYTTDRPKGKRGMETVFKYPNVPVGVHGTPGTPGVGYITPDQLQKELQRERQQWELTKRLEDMEAALEHEKESTAINKIANRFMDNPDALEKLTAFCEALLVKVFSPQTARIGVQGIGDQPDDQEAILRSQQAAIEEAVQRIEKHFPDLAAFFTTLADFIDDNPAMAKSFFSQQAKKNANG